MVGAWEVLSSWAGGMWGRAEGEVRLGRLPSEPEPLEHIGDRSAPRWRRVCRRCGGGRRACGTAGILPSRLPEMYGCDGVANAALNSFELK